MITVRNWMPSASKSGKLYVSGSTEETPLAIDAGNIVQHCDIGGAERWGKASTTNDLFKILYIERTRRFGGQSPEVYFGHPFEQTGLVVQAWKGYDYNTTNQMLGEHVLLELVDGMEITVDNNSFNDQATYTIGGKIFVDGSNPGKVTQNDSPSAGDLRLGYVTTLPDNDNGRLTWRVDKRQILS